MDQEIWKDIPGYEHFYKISDKGNIKSCRKPDRLMKIRIVGAGYQQVKFSVKGIAKEFKVHKLVMETFLGPRPFGYQINHKNGIKTDNSFNNLEYVTAKENQRHAIAHGFFQDSSGIKNPMATKTEEMIHSIRQEFDASNKRESARILSEKHGIRRAEVYRIAYRLRWKHL